jgi:HSP20 family protein
MTHHGELSSTMRRNPFEELEDMFDRMGRQLETGTLAEFKSVPVDLQDHGDEYTLVADLPGYDAADIELTYADGTLRIDADREHEFEDADDETGRYVHRERRETVNRTVRIPDPVVEDDITASQTNGTLTVTLPKETSSDNEHSIQID